MTTVAEVMNDVALECAMSLPVSWVASTTRRTYAEMLSILRITVRELLDRVDWPDPITVDYTITGDGVTTEHALPAAFRRLTFDEVAMYETTTLRRACIPVTSNGAWTHLEQIGSTAGERFYRLAGDESSGFTVEFYRPLDTGDEVIVSYVSNNWLKIGSTDGSEWTDDEATLLLPSELVRIGCVWRFKKRKGFPFQADLNEYEGKLARLANQRRRRQVISYGESSDEMKPMRVPVPDYIPQA